MGEIIDLSNNLRMTKGKSSKEDNSTEFVCNTDVKDQESRWIL